MTKDELTLLRANILGGLNEYIKATCENETGWELWITLGVPDECDEETLMEIAENGDDFWRLLRIASSVVDPDDD